MSVSIAGFGYGFLESMRDGATGDFLILSCGSPYYLRGAVDSWCCGQPGGVVGGRGHMIV